MPIYGYRCTICGEEIEVLQAMSAAPLTICELCGGRLEKKLYPVGVLFKGSGFYSTDYKRAPEKPQEGRQQEGRQQEARQDGKENGAKSGSDRSERAQKKDQAATGSESASKREAASSSTSGPAAKGGD